jgi:hypothetical protein
MPPRRINAGVTGKQPFVSMARRVMLPAVAEPTA